MTVKRYVSYDNMHTMLNTMYRQMTLDGYKPDVIVGITRGGLVPAVHFSHYFDVPMKTIQYSLRDHAVLTDTGDVAGPDFACIHDALITGKNILFVDDICDEGHTLFNIMVAINNLPVFNNAIDPSLVKTAVLQHNMGATLFSPDYCGDEINKVDKPEWIVYPWEY